MPCLNDVINSKQVRVLLEQADANLGAIGYTEHGQRHANLVAERAREVLMKLGYSERLAELAAIGGYLHDIGNAVNRSAHAESGAFFVYNILPELGFSYEETVLVMGAVANHDEEHGEPVSTIACAVIIADKSDVHRSRVRTLKEIDFDIHDRVNYAVKKSSLRTDGESKTITLQLKVDTRISKVMEYFEIFLTRMMVCRRAAKFLGSEFKLVINGTKFL